jgi:hypothetical protein
MYSLSALRPSGWVALLLVVFLLPAPAAALHDGAWTTLSPGGTLPAARYGHAAVYDPVRGRMIVFGGYDDVTRFNDVWALSLTGSPAWTQLTPAGTPPEARFCHTAVYDPVSGRMIVFGGFAGTYLGFTGPHFDDVWALSLDESPTWTQLAPTGSLPAARQRHTAVYDPVGERMLIYGGRDGSTYYDDVWAMSLGPTPGWTQLAPAGTSPGPRYGHTAIYDPPRDRMVVFGGRLSGAGESNDTWTLSLGETPAWTELSPAGTLPLQRRSHVVIYDAPRDRMITFGGYLGIGGGPDYSNDPWALSLGETPAWSELSPTDEETQQETFSASAVYDPVRDRMLVFGGSIVQYLFNDTWALTWGTMVPVQLALVSADAEPGLVRLTWYAASGSGLTATVYRCAVGAAWRAIGTITADGTGRLAYEDRAVLAGTRYGYRLGVMDGGVETYLGEAWVDVPVAAALALAGAQPNPATRDLSVSFTLPDASPARLEAFDMAGRRVASRDVGALGAGSHVVRLGEDAGLDCGVYLLRLTQGTRTLTTRAAIVR